MSVLWGRRSNWGARRSSAQPGRVRLGTQCAHRQQCAAVKKKELGDHTRIRHCPWTGEFGEEVHSPRFGPSSACANHPVRWSFRKGKEKMAKVCGKARGESKSSSRSKKKVGGGRYTRSACRQVSTIWAWVAGRWHAGRQAKREDIDRGMQAWGGNTGAGVCRLGAGNKCSNKWWGAGMHVRATNRSTNESQCTACMGHGERSGNGPCLQVLQVHCPPVPAVPADRPRRVPPSLPVAFLSFPLPLSLLYRWDILVRCEMLRGNIGILILLNQMN